MSSQSRSRLHDTEEIYSSNFLRMGGFFAQHLFIFFVNEILLHSMFEAGFDAR